MEAGDLTKIATPREMILALLMFFALIMVFYKILYTPKAMEFKALQNQAVQLATEKKTLTTQNQDLLSQKKKKQAQQSQTSSNDKFLILKGDIKPTYKNMSSLLSFITTSSSRNGLALGSLATSKASDSEGYSKSPFTIKASGQFNQILAFIDQLDNIQALVSIDSILLTDDDMIEGQMDIELKGTLYQLEDLNVTTLQQ